MLVGSVFAVILVLLTLALFQLRRIASEFSFFEYFREDYLHRMEYFLSPWTCCAQAEEGSGQGRSTWWIAPILSCSETIVKSTPNAPTQEQKTGQEEQASPGIVGDGTGQVKQWGYQQREQQEQLPGEEQEPQEQLQALQSQELPVEETQTLSQDPEQIREALPKQYFQPHEKTAEVSLEPLKEYETLVKEFYTVDPTTMIGSDQLNVEKLIARDMRIDKGGEGPQILIYHTHSQEGFRDSVPGDPATTIVGVGEVLTTILQEDYGYIVLHHTGEYDKPSRNEAYSRALPEIERILEEYPSIQVVIDLHRDEMPERTRLVTEIDGKDTAKFMFFNGLSRTRQTGNLDYLYNVYLEDNLAFSFQMEKAAKEYYPGLTRKIYLKGYRYNMHLKPRTLLIELGAQNNTLEEAVNACGPLAHLLDVVLQGK